jgi:enoyl-CoA hydratase
MSTLITTQVRNGVGLIELARPERFNCLSVDVFRQVSVALQEFESDSKIGAVLLGAQGKNFCTGAELDEVISVRTDATKLREFLEVGHRVLNQIEDSRLPVIAAVQGLCLAGGLELAMASDVVFAADDARFGDQHAHFGLVPGWGGSQRLPRLIGQRRAMDLMISARWIGAGDALTWGLANYVVKADELRPAAHSYCEGVARRSKAGIGLMKRLASPAARDNLRADLRSEVEAAIPLLMSRDAEEGVSAFKQRREPKFD